MLATIKMCGITTEEAACEAAAVGCAYVGFVFYPPSPRHLDISTATMIRNILPASCKSVAVTVNADDNMIASIMRSVVPDALQLHGNETPQRLAGLRAQYPRTMLIKSIAVKSKNDLDEAARYEDTADMFLFDAKADNAKLPGGNGQAFDWTLLAGRSFDKPWFLSGGLTPDNVAQALRDSGAAMVDVSTGIESKPGVKDPALMRAFAKAAMI